LGALGRPGGAHGVQHPLRQDQPVSGDHHGVGLCGVYGLARRCRVCRVFAIEPQAARLGHCDAVRLRKLLHRRGLQLHATTGGSIGLGQHQRDLMAGGMQLLQRRVSKCRRTGENNFHGRSGWGNSSTLGA
jgi:hypothetical protein